MAEYINKSTLLKSFAPIYEHDRYTGLTFETAKQIITDYINSFPTVDAIPVEWIKRHIAELRAEVERKIEEENYTDYGLCDDAYGMERLLADWEKENGIEESTRSI